MGLKKALSSPNGAMRKGWNGITISRDTIHIPGIELGFKHPVLFDRHAVGGEYGAGWKPVGAGKLVTTFFPDDNRWVMHTSFTVTQQPVSASSGPQAGGGAGLFQLQAPR